MLVEALLPLEHEQLDALTALQPLVASASPSLAVRAEIYAGLTRILSRLRAGGAAGGAAGGKAGGKAGAMLHRESFHLLQELVLLRYRRLLYFPAAGAPRLAGALQART